VNVVKSLPKFNFTFIMGCIIVTSLVNERLKVLH